MGAGEGAALVAEKLALDDRLGEGGAVDRDEGPSGAPRTLVDGPGHKFLAGPAFAGDQDRRLGRRDAVHQREKLAHRRGAADDALGVPGGLVPVRLGMLGKGRRGARKDGRVRGAVPVRLEIAAQTTAEHESVGDEGGAGEEQTHGALRRRGSEVEGDGARGRPADDYRHGEAAGAFQRMSFHDGSRDERNPGISLGIRGRAARNPAAQKGLVDFGARRDEQRLVGLSAQGREAAAQAGAGLDELDERRHRVGQLGMPAEKSGHFEEQRQVLGGGRQQ